MISYDKVDKALQHLSAQYQNLQTLGCEQPELIKEAVAESVIQRFETSYDCLWKILKRFLTEDLGLPDVPNSPKPIFRQANENQLLDDHIERWLAYADARIATSHDYSGEKAQQALLLMADFITDAQRVMQKLQSVT